MLCANALPVRLGIMMDTAIVALTMVLTRAAWVIEVLHVFELNPAPLTAVLRDRRFIASVMLFYCASQSRVRASFDVNNPSECLPKNTTLVKCRLLSGRKIAVN